MLQREGQIHDSGLEPPALLPCTPLFPQIGFYEQRAIIIIAVRVPVELSASNDIPRQCSPKFESELLDGETGRPFGLAATIAGLSRSSARPA